MSKSNSSTFRDRLASFESRSRPTTATAYRSVAGDLANMFTQQRTSRVASIAKSIDSVLDTPPASPPVRQLATLRPSWIGPPPSERPTTPGVQAMKQTVTVEYSSPGLQSPVYIFTSLSDPQWDAVEMHRETNDHGGYVFSKVFHVEEGEYQYKFRLGEGDWWICDESKPTVDDGHGNKNNLLVVKSEPTPKPELTESKPPKAEPKEDKDASENLQSARKAPEVVSLPKPQVQPHSMMTSASEEPSAPAPPLKHEVFDPHKGAAAEQTPERDEPNPFEVDEEEPEDSATHVSTEHEKNLSPLLRHESVTLSSVEQEHAPLFRHESISLGYNHHESPARYITPIMTPLKATSSPPIPMEADPQDHTLEKFPIDHAGIIEKIRHTHKRLPEDETSDDNALDSPISQAMSDSSISTPSLRIVREAEEEILEKIREAEEEEVEREEATGEEVDPLRPTAPITPPTTPPEPEDSDFEPKTPESYEKIEIEERIIIEIVEQRRGFFEVLLDKIGGQGNAIAVALGLLVIAAGICSMQFM